MELAACLLREEYQEPRLSRRVAGFFFDDTSAARKNRDAYRRR
jgi:hypothetical protein